MRTIRRVLVAGAIAGAALGFAGNEPAEAYCGPEATTASTTQRSNGCSNPCPTPPKILDRYGLGWSCLQ